MLRFQNDSILQGVSQILVSLRERGKRTYRLKRREELPSYDLKQPMICDDQGPMSYGNRTSVRKTICNVALNAQHTSDQYQGVR